MDGSWVQYGMFWATIALALVTIAATGINYFVFRTIVDPQVALYAATDPERSGIVLLVVENIGKGVARNIRFEFSEPLPAKAFGTDEAKAPVAPKMEEGPLIDGIPNLGPGGKRVITWGQYGGLHKAVGDRTIRAKVRYQSNSWHPFDPTDHVAEFDIDVRSFLHTDASEANAVKMRREVEKVAGHLDSVRRAVERIAASGEQMAAAAEPVESDQVEMPAEM